MKRRNRKKGVIQHLNPQNDDVGNDKYYYAVRIGRNKGIYLNRDKALEQVNGYKGADMKKVKGIVNARAYINREPKIKRRKYYVVDINGERTIYKNKEKALRIQNANSEAVITIIKGLGEAKYFAMTNSQKQASIPIIYVDGSYMQDKTISSYGYAVELNGLFFQRDFGTITDSDMLQLQSLGTELYACIRAMEWAIANNYKSICIVYDCDGIVNLIRKKNKAHRNKGKKKFLKLFLKYNQYVKVEFEHKNKSKNFKRKHLESHHLSRLTADLLM